TKDRARHEGKIEDGNTGPSAAPGAESPQNHQPYDRRHWIKPLPPKAGGDYPTFIHEGEIRRPQQFTEIEPKSPTSHHASFGKRERPGSAFGPNVIHLHPGGHQTHHQSDCEHRYEGHDVMTGNAA